MYPDSKLCFFEVGSWSGEKIFSLTSVEYLPFSEIKTISQPPESFPKQEQNHVFGNSVHDYLKNNERVKKLFLRRPGSG